MSWIWKDISRSRDPLTSWATTAARVKPSRSRSSNIQRAWLTRRDDGVVSRVRSEPASARQAHQLP
jgi:hypothetical protein